MPKQIHDIRDFLQKVRDKHAQSVKIKRTGKITKFKLRFAKYLYTLVVKDKERAEKIAKSFPQNLRVVKISNKNRRKKD